MKIHLLIPVLLSALLPGALQSHAAEPSLQELCDSLDYYLEHRAEYLRPKEAYIDSLREIAKEAEGGRTLQTAKLYMQLADAYRPVKVDSSLYFYGKSLEISRPQLEGDTAAFAVYLNARLKRNSLMPLRGMAHEAILDFDSIRADTIQDMALRKAYFQSGSDLFTNVAATYKEGAEQTKHLHRAVGFVDSLMKYQRPHGLAYRLSNAHRWKLTGERSEAIAELLDTLYVLRDRPALMASGASVLAKYYSMFPTKKEEQLYYQTLSAINDIKAGHREITSLQKLGEEWYERGDDKRAYRYLNIALSEAVAAGSTARILESSPSLPIIAKDVEERVNHSQRLLIALVVILIAALVIILIMTAYLYREHRRQEKLGAHLAELNRNKDIYIQNVMMLCSVFFERLDEFNRYVARKIKANQIKDLYDSIESRRYLTTQTDEFFKSFDATFRTIHPNFTTQLNEILQPERRLPIPAPGEPMSPELRIAAFMRLGIDDSATLAKFLGLSLNTIYTYRNRLKNRAMHRETFETDIKNVDF